MSESNHSEFTHQHDGIRARRFGLGLVAFAAFVGLSGLVMWALLTTIWKPVGSASPAFGATSLPTAKPPTVDRIELQKLVHRERQRLNDYGWVDKKAGIVHIPIDEAMKRMVQHGEDAP